MCAGDSRFDDRVVEWQHTDHVLHGDRTGQYLLPETAEIGQRHIRRRGLEIIAADPGQTKVVMRLMAVSRNLERIADLATNIAEDVIYMVDGKIIRHQEGA